MPVTCQETSIPGLLVLILKLPLVIFCATTLARIDHHSELIAEIGVEGFKPCRHRDNCRATAVCDDVAVINVHHVGRFDEGVVEIFIGRIEWMIDLKGAPGLAEIAGNVHVASEIPGETTARSTVSVYSITGTRG
jgi:hypothetical protein